MPWNYRVIRHPGPKGRTWVGIHTTYYDEHGKIHSWCAEPVVSAHYLDDLIGEMRLLLDAAEMAKSILHDRRVMDEAEMPGEK